MSGKCVFSLCVWLFSASVLGAQQSPFTINTVDGLVRAGLASNRDVQAVQQRIAEAKGVARQAGVRPTPSVALSGASGDALGSVGESAYSAQYSQTVETFGKRGKRIDVAQFAIGSAEAELQERSAQLAYGIRASFAELMSERHKVQLLGDLATLNQNALRLTEARVHEGDVAPLEASLLRVEVNQSKILQASAQGRLVSAELELRRLTGVGPAAVLPSQDEEIHPPMPLEALKERALEDRADLKSARFAERQGQAATKLASAEAKPDLTFSGGYARQNNQFDGLFGQTAAGALAPIKDQNDILNFGISLPLRTARSNLGNVEAASARTAGARLHREYLERTIPLEVEAAYRRWTVAINSVDTLRAGVIDPSTANLSVIREAYRAGQLRILDVINEQRRLADAQSAYIDAQTDVARSWADVERAIGGDLP